MAELPFRAVSLWPSSINNLPGNYFATVPGTGYSYNIATSGSDQVGITPPEGRNDVTGHLTDIVSYNKGAHQLRSGGEFRQGRIDEFYFRRSTGAFTFDGTQRPWSTFCTSSRKVSGCNVNSTALEDFLASDRQHILYWRRRCGTLRARERDLNFGLRYDYYGPLHYNKRTE